MAVCVLAQANPTSFLTTWIGKAWWVVDGWAEEFLSVYWWSMKNLWLMNVKPGLITP
jgi:hypothetical protein